MLSSIFFLFFERFISGFFSKSYFIFLNANSAIHWMAQNILYYIFLDYLNFVSFTYLFFYYFCFHRNIVMCFNFSVVMFSIILLTSRKLYILFFDTFSSDSCKKLFMSSVHSLNIKILPSTLSVEFFKLGVYI